MASKRPKAVVATIAAFVMAVSLSFPALAFAEVKIDDTVINEGENAVGGGTATLTETVLDMVNVVADVVTTDQDLTMNFNGGNEIDDVVVNGNANVTANFTGENSVEDFTVGGEGQLTLNADGHNDFEEVLAYENSNVIINVTGENGFEDIFGYDNANITVRGTDCQKKDIVNIEDDDTASLATMNGTLTIDHVTVNLKGKIESTLGTYEGNLVIDTSKVKAEDDAWTWILAGGEMSIAESVIEIAGEVFSSGMMTIDHSDVRAKKPKDVSYELPYRVFSETGIELINEKNGEVREGEIDGQKAWYVDTDNNNGSDVDLKADGEPGYYKCKSSTAKGMPKTGDATTAHTFAILALASLFTAAYAVRRRSERGDA